MTIIDKYYIAMDGRYLVRIERHHRRDDAVSARICRVLRKGSERFVDDVITFGTERLGELVLQEGQLALGQRTKSLVRIDGEAGHHDEAVVCTVLSYNGDAGTGADGMTLRIAPKNLIPADHTGQPLSNHYHNDHRDKWFVPHNSPKWANAHDQHQGDADMAHYNTDTTDTTNTTNNTNTQYKLNIDYLADAISERQKKEAHDYAKAAMERHYPKMVKLVLGCKPGDVIRYRTNVVGWQFICKIDVDTWVCRNGDSNTMSDDHLIKKLTERRAQGVKVKKMVVK